MLSGVTRDTVRASSTDYRRSCGKGPAGRVNVRFINAQGDPGAASVDNAQEYGLLQSGVHVTVWKQHHADVAD